MTLPIHENQEQLLNRSSISPIFLVDLTSAAGTLRFCTNRAVTYLGNLYQPYLSTAGVLRTAASFPENNTSSKELQLQFNNGQIELEGTTYGHLSQIFYPVFPWELADVHVRLLLTDGETDTFTEDVAMDWVASGIAGAPTAIDRQKFLLPVYTRNYKLNDQIPLRPVSVEDFPEADRDELNGRTYIPIVVGSGVRVQALATTAGATTTTTEEVNTGTTLKVSETTGFSPSDEIIINGFVDDPFTIGAVDAANNQFTGLSPNLSTLGQTISLGTIVRENKTEYDYTVADHECGSISEVRVTPHGEKDPVVISGSLYSKVTVDDDNAIGGKRTDVRITQLVPFGSASEGGVSQQPEFSVDDGNHDHNVSVSQISITTSFAGSTSPAGGSAANDGNTDTFYGLSTGGTTSLTYQSFSNVSGDHVRQRYYMVAAGPTVAGNVRIRRGVIAYLTLSSAFGKGEFRSSPDSGGSDTSTWNVVVQTSPTTCNLYEGWKEVESMPAVSEDTKDLSNTTRDTDVSVDVSGADIEIGDKVEVVIDGVPVPDDSGRYGDVTASGTAIQRPDAVARWFLEEVLGQTEGIMDLATYSGSAESYASNDIRLSFALQEPMKLDTLLDQIADNSQSMNYWGRSGHALKYLDEPTVTRTFSEDTEGVISIDWRNAHAAADIRNHLTAFYGRDWTRTANRDEAYAGSVIATNSGSQTRYGVRGNEVVGSNKTFKLDFTPTEAQAQSILDAILTDKADPQTEFNISADWSYINIAPGDVVDVSSPTLGTPLRARVIENSVDSRLFTRIVAKEIGTAEADIPTGPAEGSIAPDNKGFFMDHGADTELDINIANQWTLMYRFKRVLGEDTSEKTWIGINSDSTNNSLLNIQNSSAYVEIKLFDKDFTSSGDSLEYRYMPHSTSTSTWQVMFVTFDGTRDSGQRIALYRPIGFAITSVSADSTTSTPQDDEIEQENVARHVRVAKFHKKNQLAIWDRVLTDNEILFLARNVGWNLNYDSSDSISTYSASDALQHWYRLGSDVNNVGADYSQVAVDAGNEADMSRLWYGWPTDQTEPADLVTDDIPTPSRDGVPI